MQPSRFGKRPSKQELVLDNLLDYLEFSGQSRARRLLPSTVRSHLVKLIEANDSELQTIIEIYQSTTRNRDLDWFEQSICRRVASDWNESFENFFGHCQLNTASIAANEERLSRGWPMNHALIYGEMTLETIICLLTRHVRPKEHAVFADIGSGIGKTIIAAAMSHSFTRLIGVEIFDALCQQSYQALNSFLSQTSISQSNTPIIDVMCSDFRVNHEWHTADVVFVNSTAFDELLMHDLSRCCEYLLLGSIVVTLTRRLSSPHFRLIEEARYPCSWGDADAFIHVKVQPKRVDDHTIYYND